MVSGAAQHPTVPRMAPQGNSLAWTSAGLLLKFQVCKVRMPRGGGLESNVWGQRANSLEKTLMLGKIENRRRRG